MYATGRIEGLQDSLTIFEIPWITFFPSSFSTSKGKRQKNIALSSRLGKDGSPSLVKLPAVKDKGGKDFLVLEYDFPPSSLSSIKAMLGTFPTSAFHLLFSRRFSFLSCSKQLPCPCLYDEGRNCQLQILRSQFSSHFLILSPCCAASLFGPAFFSLCASFFRCIVTPRRFSVSLPTNIISDVVASPTQTFRSIVTLLHCSLSAFSGPCPLATAKLYSQLLAFALVGNPTTYQPSSSSSYFLRTLCFLSFTHHANPPSSCLPGSGFTL